MLLRKYISRPAALLALLCACLLLSGCGTEEPEVSLRGLTEAALKMDKAGLEKYGVKEDLKTDGVQHLAKGLKESTDGMLTEADCKAIAEAFVTKFNELQVQEVKTESKSDSEARVAVTIDKVTVAMPEQPPAEIQARIKQAKSVEDLSSIIRDVLVQVVQEAPKDGAATVTVDCKVDKERNVWVPKNSEQFIGELLEKGVEMK